jgi:acetaldehyde dehydrogenase (acetylating)
LATTTGQHTAPLPAAPADVRIEELRKVFGEVVAVDAACSAGPGAIA